jgi:hypothetical protein
VRDFLFHLYGRVGFYQLLPQIYTEMAVVPDFDAPMASMGTMAPFRKGLDAIALLSCSKSLDIFQ